MDDDPPARSRRTLAVALVLLSTAFFGLVLIAPYAAAQDVYVSGPITKDTTWSALDTYYVIGDVTVISGVTLTIEPGTSVYFDSGRALFVEGILTADGLQSSMIRFLPNASILPIPWTGIQFNASSTGSITWSSFVRADRAVTAIDSSPTISNNFVESAGWGFALLRSTTYLADNFVNRSGVGIYVAESNAQVVRNQVNGSTLFGIRAETSGAVEISENTVTNTRSLFAIGIYTSGVTPTITGNWIQGVTGRDGSAGVGAGAPGEDGGYAIGILVDGAGSATVFSNTIDSASGGRGGNGAANSGATGGRGGSGGPAAGIVLANVGTADVEWNSVTNIFGGRGGTGGQSGGTSTGGVGGEAGDAAAIQVVGAATAARYYGNVANTILGGVGGHGGDGGFVDGTGGSGGDAIGISSWGAMDADASGNTLQTVRGGLGGNSTVLGGGNRAAGAGGPGTGIALFGPAGSSVVHSNSVFDLSGGDGGRGSPGGAGGDGTGILVLGNNDGLFNATSISSNSLEQIAGGDGGIGPTRGGEGGAGTGIAGILTTASMAWNWILTLQGGSGAAGAVGGRGGDAVGIVGALVRGSSVGDSIEGVTGGSPGAPPPAEVALGMGLYVGGSTSFTSQFTIDNVTLSNVADYDFLAADYADVTTINAIVVDGRLSVWPAGNLTVRNFLGVDVLWPDGVTLVPGVGILVEDDVGPVWDFVSSSGRELWLLVTDRVYVNSNTATEIPTKVTVTYGSENFQNNPRDVGMATSHTEPFVMVDRAAPTSAATPLPTYETALTFSVGYTASDGNGTGLGDITLWYRTGGSGGWTAYATQPASGTGQFSFTASAEGLHEFATTVDDLSGNQESGPNANETWTIVDTVLPASHVNPLPQYETSSSFVLSWAPETGVTDVVKYTVQYNAGAGWVDWLVDTPATSGTFTAGTQGPYAFRSIAEDAAGNVEITSAGNDTWTIVDTIQPSSRVLPLSTYQTSASFVVSWGPQFGTTDIATYRIEVRDNGGAWTDWIGSTAATSSTFSGEDGHTYEFRSIAQDRAGNVETTAPANDTWTVIDATTPTVTVFVPSGTSVGPTSPIVITFSEPMNTTATEAAVSVTPSLVGAFSWNANRTVLTFVSSNPLSDQTQYTVVIGSGARDQAGNTLSQRVFQFTTAGAIPNATSFLGDFWWMFLAVGAVVGASLFLVMRRRTAAASKPAQPAAVKASEAIVEDVFLLYHRDGLLIKHETRRLRPDVDTDILSGMLTAVQAFVKDALRGDDSADLNEMTVGHMHILIGRGKWLVLAARIEGDGSETWTDQIQRCIQDMEDHHWDQLEDWDGDMALAGVLAPYIKKLIRGEYA